MTLFKLWSKGGSKNFFSPPSPSPPPLADKNVNNKKKVGCMSDWIFHRIRFSFWGFLKIGSWFLESFMRCCSLVSWNWRQQFECILFFPFFAKRKLYRLFSCQISSKYCFVHNDYVSSFLFFFERWCHNKFWLVHNVTMTSFSKMTSFFEKNSEMKDFFDP